MIFLITAAGCSVLFALSHVVAFRMRLVGHRFSTLIMLTLPWALVYALATRTLEGRPHSTDVWHAPLSVTGLVLFELLALCYVVGVNGLDYTSPSMMIINAVAAAGELDDEQLRTRLTNEALIVARMDDLLAGQYIAFDGRQYSLLPRGRQVARIIGAYRALMRRGFGG